MTKFSFQKQVLTGFAIALILMFFLALSGYINFKDSQNDAGWIAHTQQVIAETNAVNASLIKAENIYKEYLISNSNKNYREFELATNGVQQKLESLRNLVSDNPIQVNRVGLLISLSSVNFNNMHDGIDLAKANGQGSSQNLYHYNIISNSSKIDVIIQQIINAENMLLSKRKLQSEVGSKRTIITIVIGSVVVFLVILVLLSYIIKTFKKQKVTEDQALQTNINLERISRENEQQTWLLEGAVIVDSAMRGAQTLEERTSSIIKEISKYVKADLGVIYLTNAENDQLDFHSAYALPPDKVKRQINKDEGLIGQALIEKKGKLFQNIPAGYFKIQSALGDTLPKAIFVQPVFLNEDLKAVIELAFIDTLNEKTVDLFNKVTYSIGVALQAAEGRIKMLALIDQTQQQAEELVSQQEELRTANDELTHKSDMLQASEEELRVQQEELRQINAELEEKATMLEEQNQEIDQAREAITLKAEELERTSKFKSEFLANMSHELRTPLNSILILARILKENKKENLSDEQIKYAGVIHNAGSDLLTLINDILDLSKIEAGKIDIQFESVDINEVKEDLQHLFNEVANNKKISFSCNIHQGVQKEMFSDKIRLEQILKNLLSNAFKFTPEQGSVTVDIALANSTHQFYSENLKNYQKPIISFSITDTGIGIPEDKQSVIFEAFQQEDGSTNRKYGGTGLGLSISRELSFLLGGEINVQSERNRGSKFTLFLPLEADVNISDESKPEDEKPVEKVQQLSQINIQPAASGKKQTLLIIEDDVNFAEVLKDYAIERGFEPLLANQGDIGLEMAKKHLPDAIVLDIMLPVMNGWEVLKQLKADAKTSSIAVHMMSASDERLTKATQAGAIGFLKKPADLDKLEDAFTLLKNIKTSSLQKILIIEDHHIQSENLRSQLVDNKIEVKQAFNGTEAKTILSNQTSFDCIILDLNLPDISGLDLLDWIKSEESLSAIPVVINTAMELDQATVDRIMKHTHAMVLKNKTNDRVLDEVNLFMNKLKTETIRSVSVKQESVLSSKNVATVEKALKNKSVLIVDDDMRNIFALTSALQAYDLKVEIASNGKEALRKLDEKPNTDIVLMDIMMPEMDGYEAMTEIRKQLRFGKLPIIALTAKAMKTDRDKCIASGANEYITKPIDIEKLISLMRVWLS